MGKAVPSPLLSPGSSWLNDGACVLPPAASELTSMRSSTPRWLVVICAEQLEASLSQAEGARDNELEELLTKELLGQRKPRTKKTEAGVSSQAEISAES